MNWNSRDSFVPGLSLLFFLVQRLGAGFARGLPLKRGEPSCKWAFLGAQKDASASTIFEGRAVTLSRCGLDWWFRDLNCWFS